MREYPLIRCLIVVLKQFLIYHNLLESFNGGISSYCLILLILSYLQVCVLCERLADASLLGLIHADSECYQGDELPRNRAYYLCKVFFFSAKVTKNF